MPTQHPASASSLRVAMVVLAAALVGAALYFSLSLGDPHGPDRIPEPIDIANLPPTEDDPGVSLEAVESAPLAVRSEAAVAESDRMAPDGTDTTADIDRTVRILVHVESNPWLSESGTEGTLNWSGSSGADAVKLELEPKGGALIGTIELSAAPNSLDEFTDIFVAGLSLQPLALRAVDPAPQGDALAPRFQLSLEWTQGPWLVWGDSVPQSARSMVNVSIGGSLEPRSRSDQFDQPREFVPVRHGLELPLRLPRLQREAPVWVGAAGRVWRSFAVAPSASRVEVVLEEASSIRVLHDLPDGAAPQYVLVTAFPEGETDIKPLSASGVVEFTERPPLVHEVIISANEERYDSERLSRLARLPLTAGEVAVVDLTSDYASRELGTLRVSVHASPTTLERFGKGLMGAELTLRAMSRAPLGGEHAWERAGNFVAVQQNSHDVEFYEMVGLKPGLHRVIVDPTGHSFTDEVVGGEVHEIEVSLDDLGWIQLVVPTGYPRKGIFVSLTTAEHIRGERAYVRFGSGMNDPLNAARPTAAGRYLVQVNPFLGNETPALVSDEFVVHAGETTEVVLRERAQMTIDVVAVDATTGEPVGLALNFWTEISAVGTQTGKQHGGMTSFAHSNGDSYAKISWKLDELDEPVAIRVPENPFWTFEEMEPLRLKDGAEIVLRAISKDD